MEKKILRVDMTNGRIQSVPLPISLEMLGGRGLTSRIVRDEVPPLAHPLGPNNKLVLAPGLLGGTAAPCSGRLSVGAKSPLTGGIKEANAGGTAAQKIARLGYAAIVVEGQAPAGKTYVLKLDRDAASLVATDMLKGLGNYDTVEVLRKEHGEKVAIVSIGPAGENAFSMASVAVTDTEGRPVRHAGRGGLGAVMGSKGLKAIVVDDSGCGAVAPREPDLFRSGCRKLAEALQEHPVTSQSLKQFGTAIVVNIINEAGGLPTRNFRDGRFEGAQRISGERMTEIITTRKGVPVHACHPGCIIRCSNVYLDAQGRYLTSGLEYETIVMNGSNLGIDDLDVIARIDRACDDIGIDTIEAGVTLGVAMEAGLKKFGDGQGALALLDEIRRATPLGRLLGNGAALAGQALGVVRVPVVKRQGLPAYDPRAIKGIGVTYSTSPMGADHTSGYAIASNVMNVGGSVDPLGTEGQVELSRNLQVASAALDSTGFCLFIAFAILDLPRGFEGVLETLNGALGLSWTAENFSALGASILKTEKSFNEAAGFSRGHDRLPEFFRTEKLLPHNTVFDLTDEDLDRLFDF